jgi:enamine deaminase RidA (YjgF/YER057c/UK114 family)
MSRFRPFGLASSPARLTYSPAVECGDLIFFSGITAVDAAGRVVAPGDIVGQTTYVYEKIGRLLAEAGATFNDIVETTEFFVWSEDYRRTADVRRKFLVPPYPAATGIPVPRLIRPDALIEIRAVVCRSGIAPSVSSTR